MQVRHVPLRQELGQSIPAARMACSTVTEAGAANDAASGCKVMRQSGCAVVEEGASDMPLEGFMGKKMGHFPFAATIALFFILLQVTV